MRAALLCSVPLKNRCSMKCEMPFWRRDSWREPFSTQMPRLTERVSGISREIMRMPLSRTVLLNTMAVVVKAVLLRRFRLFQRVFAAELDLALFIDLEDFHHDLVPFVEYVGDAPHALGSELGDMYETIGPRQNFHEGAEVHDLSHGPTVDFADFGLRGDALNHFHGAAARRLVARSDHHCAVVLDVDLDAGLFDDAADDLASGPYDLADLFRPDFQSNDSRRVA